MDQYAIESVLKRRLRRNASLELGLALIWGLCAAFFLFMTYWLIYAALLIGFRWLIPHSHDTRLILSGLGLLILFIGNVTTSREYLESLSFTTGTASKEVVTIYIPGVGAGSNVNPLAPDSIHSNVKLITTGLFCGPRLAVGTLRHLRRAARVLGMATKEPAAVVHLLLVRDERVSFHDLCRGLPDLSPAKVLADVCEIDGVLVLTSEPPGLKLSGELRDELLAAMG